MNVPLELWESDSSGHLRFFQVCKEQKLSERLEVFSKATGIYNYGMICYEILSGKFLFDGHSQNEYNLVIKGQRPVVPEYIEDWTCALLNRCWQSILSFRPIMGEVLNLLLANLEEVREIEKFRKELFGENFKIRHHIEILN